MNKYRKYFEEYLNNYSCIWTREECLDHFIQAQLRAIAYYTRRNIPFCVPDAGDLADLMQYERNRRRRNGNQKQQGTQSPTRVQGGYLT
jgi:hypothetical protein